MTDWDGKKVIMVGAARQGLALSRYLAGKGASVTVNDQRPEAELADIKTSLSQHGIRLVADSHPLELLDGVDLVCLSGGVPLQLPLIQEALLRNIPLSNDSQIFLERVPCKVIGITGSAGKSTTTALVGEIAQRHFLLRHPSNTVWVGGNIGNPLISYLDQIQPDDLAVMELSSFQLEIMTRSPQIAAILNLTPNHLDRHITMANYISAKSQILTHQSPNGIAVLNRDDGNVRELYGEVKGRKITFGLNMPHDRQEATYYKRGKLFLQASGQAAKIINENMITLRGKHNVYNILAAIAISAAASFSMQAIYEGISSFKGMPHRMEFIRQLHGADWYNDSIATAPERTIAALESFEEPIVLLAGGRDKDLPWEKLAQRIHECVDHLVVFGEAAELIEKAVGSSSPDQRPFTLDRCKGLQDAVLVAAERAEAGDVVLLSPGGTSFDEFIDFEDRGRCFIKWVKELS